VELGKRLIDKIQYEYEEVRGQNGHCESQALILTLVAPVRSQANFRAFAPNDALQSVSHQDCELATATSSAKNVRYLGKGHDFLRLMTQTGHARPRSS
jgi:hypothetical protein